MRHWIWTFLINRTSKSEVLFPTPAQSRRRISSASSAVQQLQAWTSHYSNSKVQKKSDWHSGLCSIVELEIWPEKGFTGWECITHHISARTQWVMLWSERCSGLDNTQYLRECIQIFVVLFLCVCALFSQNVAIAKDDCEKHNSIKEIIVKFIKVLEKWIYTCNFWTSEPSISSLLHICIIPYYTRTHN